MQIVIDIPEKEFGIEIADKFQDFFKRLEAETKEHMISGTNLLCGAYELETIQMLMQALAKSTPLPNALEYLETAYTGARACDDVAEQVRLARAIAAYKQDVHEDCTNEKDLLYLGACKHSILEMLEKGRNGVFLFKYKKYVELVDVLEWIDKKIGEGE